MASILPNFEYDIFISYRQKDNKGEHWVTNFVNSLKTELEATFKEDISIFFDENPHDGLLANHDVDDSLKSKLRCLIFIPIISQTYCDKKSFAWESEFVAFKKLASEDTLGLKVKLANGNVASRILPICIHELDEADKQLVEGELGGVMRGIEFIYKTAGVVRPLKEYEDDAKANLNHTFYNDQINKVARACKDLIAGIRLVNTSTKKPNGHQPEIKPNARKRIGLAALVICVLGMTGFCFYYFGGFGRQLGELPDRSIAVIPFENMNKDPGQDYFSNGIAEDILNHLTKVSDLKVKSRTSTLQYKGTTKTVPEIGEELNVSNVVEGSVRRVGDKVRIVVQLIDAKTDNHLWSETYDRDFKDVLALQSEIAIEIAKALQVRLTSVEKNSIQKEASQNVTAYDYYLKARDKYYKSNGERRDNDNSLLLVNQSLQLDSNFSKAYALKAWVWFDRSGFGVSQKTWQDSAMYFSSKAISKDPSLPDGYLAQASVNRFLGDIKKANEYYHKAYEVAPNDPDVLRYYGALLLREHDERGADMLLKSLQNRFSLKDAEYYMTLGDLYAATGDVATPEKLLKKARSLGPGSVSTHASLSYFYFSQGRYKEGIQELEEAEKINPGLQIVADRLAWLHYKNNDLANAAKYWLRLKEIEDSLDDSTQVLPYRNRLGMVYADMGKKKEADKLFAEDLKIHLELLNGKRSMGAWGNRGSVYYDLAVDNAYFRNDAKAVQILDSALYYQFYYDDGYAKDPMFALLQNRQDFKKVTKKFDDFLAFGKIAFSNALNRQNASKELKNVLK